MPADTPPTEAADTSPAPTAPAPPPEPVRIGVLTSGGDAQGMNAAVRCLLITSLDVSRG